MGLDGGEGAGGGLDGAALARIGARNHYSSACKHVRLQACKHLKEIFQPGFHSATIWFYNNNFKSYLCREYL